jgi:hypothetical protein
MMKIAFTPVSLLFAGGQNKAAHRNPGVQEAYLRAMFDFKMGDGDVVLLRRFATQKDPKSKGAVTHDEAVAVLGRFMKEIPRAPLRFLQEVISGRHEKVRGLNLH